jgi:uncharacterized membrane protein YgcG
MRKIIVSGSLLLSLFTAACSKSALSTNGGDNQTPVSPAANSAPTVTSGSGRPAGAIDDGGVAAPQVETGGQLPQRVGFINDYANVLDGKTKEDLEASLKKLKGDSKIEFVVVTVDTTGGQPTTEYAMEVVRLWEIGSEGRSGGGLILLVALKDRRWAIRWSPELKDSLEGGTEGELERKMSAPFRQGNYSEGISKGVRAVLSRLARRRGVP